MEATTILEQLVAFPSVVGKPNGAIVDWICDYLAACNVPVRVLPGPEGDRSNLFASIGPAQVPGFILSGHMDVVPAGEPEWRSEPFKLARSGNRLVGRGSSDMKGYLAAVLAAVPRLTRLNLQRPIHLAFSYDEEAGCKGVPHLLKHLPVLCAPPLGAIVGEPSNLVAIRAHKGKASAKVTIKGRAGHSSRPDLGLNAIHAMGSVVAAAMACAERLTHGPLDPAFEPPYSSMQVGTIRGGLAVNIIPEYCEVQLEARAISGVDPAELLRPLRSAAEALIAQGFAVEWFDQSAYPALTLASDAPLTKMLEDLTGAPSLAAVSYGTEAGLFQAAGVPAIICGPGDIARAHRPNEFIFVEELEACRAMIEALGQRCAHA